MIGKSGERGSGIFVLPARHDANDDDDIWFRRKLIIYKDIVKGVLINRYM